MPFSLSEPAVLYELLLERFVVLLLYIIPLFQSAVCYGAKIAGEVIKGKRVAFDFTGVVGELASKSRDSRLGGAEILRDPQQ